MGNIGSKNFQDLGFENGVFKRIEEILNGKIKFNELILMNEKSGFLKTIDNIVNKYTQKDLFIFILEEVDSEIFKNHKEYHKDFNIVKIAINKNSSMYDFIEGGLKNDIRIAKEVIKSMVRENKNFFEVEEFITNNFSKNTKELLKLYFDFIENADDFIQDDLTKILLYIRQTDIKLFNSLKKNQIFKAIGKNIIIDNQFISKFLKQINNDQIYLQLENTKKSKYINEKLVQFFSDKKNSLPQNLEIIFNTVFKLINIENSKYIKEEKKVKKDQTEKDKIDTNQDTNNDEKENIDSYDDEGISKLLDYTFPEYSYGIVSGGYDIETLSGKKIFISNQEKQNFTTIAFKNYIKFYTTLTNLGINFLWDKYSKDFRILCDNKFGFDYIRGEGVTEFKMLGVLNMIGRNIGIPEYVFQNENGKDIKEVKCFKTLGDAKLAFEDIKKTGKINGIKYCDDSFFGNGAVENKLIEVLCIDQKGNGLNISKWK